jgi:hypothetical protein
VYDIDHLLRYLGEVEVDGFTENFWLVNVTETDFRRIEDQHREIVRQFWPKDAAKYPWLPEVADPESAREWLAMIRELPMHPDQDEQLLELLVEDYMTDFNQCLVYSEPKTYQAAAQYLLKIVEVLTGPTAPSQDLVPENPDEC